MIGLCESECDKKYTITADGEMTQFEVIAILHHYSAKKEPGYFPALFFAVFYFGKWFFQAPRKNGLTVMDSGIVSKQVHPAPANGVRLPL
jgi:hypothetical protein